jgi:hypothetical protein
VIILDTNTLSEALKPAPSDIVLRWIGAQDRADVFTTAITEAEILYGIEVMERGKRRQRLLDAAERLFGHHFRGRVLAFDHESAQQFAKLVAGRRVIGRPILEFDAIIAAIALTHRAALATRNTKKFEHCGIRLINPWTVPEVD